MSKEIDDVVDKVIRDLEADIRHQLKGESPITRRSTEHQPVPSGHAPRLETIRSTGFYGIMIQEADSGISENGQAWIHCENPVDVGELR